MEEWKEIPGFSSRYGKYYIRKDGVAKNGKGSILTIRPHYKGYKMIRMKKDNREKPTNVMIHRAVCLAWLPNTEGKPQINHINGIKTDNRLENLEWVTNMENHIHAVRLGLKPKADGIYKGKHRIMIGPKVKYRGSMHPGSTINEDIAREIKAAVFTREFSRSQLCEKFGISLHIVKDIRRNKTWVHI